LKKAGKMVPRRFMLITAGFLLTTFVVYQFLPVSFLPSHLLFSC
jgi:hypothetical protein